MNPFLKPCALSLALCLAISLLSSHFNLKTHLQPKDLIPFGNLTSLQMETWSVPKTLFVEILMLACDQLVICLNHYCKPQYLNINYYFKQ